MPRPRAALAVAAFVPVVVMSGCASSFDVSLSGAKICAPAGTDGVVTFGTASATASAAGEITAVRLEGADNLELVGWYLAGRRDDTRRVGESEPIGAGDGFAVPAGASPRLDAGESAIVEVGVRSSDPASPGRATGVTVSYSTGMFESSSTAAFTLTVRPLGETCLGGD